MNRYLAIDTSSSYLTVLVCGGGEPVCIFEKDGALQHSVRLMDAVDEAFSRAGMRPQDCDFFCAVTGRDPLRASASAFPPSRDFARGRENPPWARPLSGCSHIMQKAKCLRSSPRAEAATMCADLTGKRG